uniref:FERM domain-containing protein 8 n=1 Tax=Plectus sambesii TaxID=2011161 RepID=A0A914UIZ4_9BILA
MNRSRGAVVDGGLDERTMFLPTKRVPEEGEENGDGSAWHQPANEEEMRSDEIGDRQQQQQGSSPTPPSVLRCDASKSREALRADLLLDENTSISGGHRRHHSADMRTMHSEPAMTHENSLAVVSEWAPRKLSEGNIFDPSAKAGNSRIRSPAKRKLSESRGVNLPDIRIVPNSPRNSFKSKDERMIERHMAPNNSLPMQTPPLTSSPITHVMRRIPLTVNTNAPLRSNSPGSTRSNLNAIINICVFLPDNRGIQFAVEGGRMATATCLIELVCEHLQIPVGLARNVFALWMMSPLLEVQLKPHHIALDVRRNWAGLLKKFTNSSQEEIEVDEPLLVFRRNVLLSVENEQDVYYHEKATEVLFLDARDQVLSGRYMCDFDDALHLAAVDMALTLGPFKETHHTLNYIREALEEFLPEQHVHAAKSFSLFGYQIVGCKGFEKEVVDEYRALSQPHDPHSLRVTYLRAVSRFPFYGAAFFHGQIERPPTKDIRKLLRTAQSDLPVLIGVNREFITVIDPHKHTVLLSQAIDDCSWRRFDNADPSNADALPSFFLHFPDDEAAAAASNDFGFKPPSSKLLQVFTRQAVMIEALLNAVYQCYALEAANDDEESAEEEEEEENGDIAADDDEVDGVVSAARINYNKSTTLSNKLSRLCLATFDEKGQCVQAQGSLRRVLQD